jgi:hypothetical protein
MRGGWPKVTLLNVTAPSLAANDTIQVMRRNYVLKPIVWIACLTPLAMLVVGAFAGTD